MAFRASRRKTSAGLDVGSGFVKLVVVDHAGDLPEVVGVSVRPVPEGAIVDGEVVDRKPVADTVREAMHEVGAKSRDVVAALGGHDVFVKRVSMPRMKESDARSAVPIEAKRHVPFDLAGVRLDFEILPRPPRGDGTGLEGGPAEPEEEMDVLITAAKQDRIEEKMALLAAAGVRPTVMDVEAFALYNALAHNHPNATEGVAALIDIGHSTTNIGVVEDGVLTLSKNLPLGSRTVAESLQLECGLSALEAESVLQGRRRVPSAHGVVTEGVATGIKRASAYLTGRESGQGIGRIFLSGGGACIPGLARALAESVRIETRRANPFERCTLHGDAASHPVLDRAAPMLLLSVGLALRAV